MVPHVNELLSEVHNSKCIRAYLKKKSFSPFTSTFSTVIIISVYIT